MAAWSVLGAEGGTTPHHTCIVPDALEEPSITGLARVCCPLRFEAAFVPFAAVFLRSGFIWQSAVAMAAGVRRDQCFLDRDRWGPRVECQQHFCRGGGGGAVGSRVENEKQLLPPAVSWERGGGDGGSRGRTLPSRR